MLKQELTGILQQGLQMSAAGSQLLRSCQAPLVRSRSRFRCADPVRDKNHLIWVYAIRRCQAVPPVPSTEKGCQSTKSTLIHGNLVILMRPARLGHRMYQIDTGCVQEQAKQSSSTARWRLSIKIVDSVAAPAHCYQAL